MTNPIEDFKSVTVDLTYGMKKLRESRVGTARVHFSKVRSYIGSLEKTNPSTEQAAYLCDEILNRIRQGQLGGLLDLYKNLREVFWRLDPQLSLRKTDLRYALSHFRTGNFTKAETHMFKVSRYLQELSQNFESKEIEELTGIARKLHEKLIFRSAGGVEQLFTQLYEKYDALTPEVRIR